MKDGFLRRPLLLACAAAALVWAGGPQRTAPANAASPQTAQTAAPPPAARQPIQPVLLPVEVVARHPHDPAAFTEGLLVHAGQLYESTGREGESDIRRVDIASGRVLARSAIPPEQFGEGLALWRDTLVSLTWHDGVAHRWDVRTLRRQRGDFRYRGEGWGLASDAAGLVMSDGTAQLRFLDGARFTERRRVTVTAGGRAIDNLNELEVIDGRIFANVWQTPFILVIAPDSGVVTHVLDLRPIVAEVNPTDPNAVLNGIAFDPARRRLYVTGKLWPTLFEIRLPDFAAAPAR